MATTGVTKESLISYFKGLDISTLEKLKKYSEFLIIPDEDLLVNATMQQMVTKAHSLADSLFPEWTDRSKSDFGEFLVELFALFSEKDFWYINAFANESILRKMRSYSNAFSKASSMGYEPVLCQGATGTFNVTFEEGEAQTYERGDLIVNVGDVKFTNDDKFTVAKAVTETTMQLTLAEGEIIAEDTTYNGFNVFIRKKNIDINSLVVTIDNITYTRVRNFGNSSKDSTHYIVLPEEDGSAIIYFGSDGYGVQPSIGKSIRVEYRICNGTEGNLDKAACEINDCLTTRKATKAVMLQNTDGGTFAETLASIREKAPLYFYTKKAAINESIAEDILNSIACVYKSKVQVVGKEVTYRVIPTSGYLEPTAKEKQTIEENFHPYLMVGYSGVYTSNNYKDLVTKANPLAKNMLLRVLLLNGYNDEVTESKIRQIIEDATNPFMNANYGGSFNKTDIDILIRTKVSGVQNVTFLLQVGTNTEVMPDVSLEPTEIFRKIDQEKLKIEITYV